MTVEVINTLWYINISTLLVDMKFMSKHAMMLVVEIKEYVELDFMVVNLINYPI